jgi:hypothetical protein
MNLEQSSNIYEQSDRSRSSNNYTYKNTNTNRSDQINEI